MESKVPEAKQFAIAAHGDQKYGDDPYSKHLQDVVNIIHSFEFPPSLELMEVAWLHDTIEDTEVTRQEIVDEFGQNIADVVFAVSCGYGKNRKDRWLNTFYKIRDNKVVDRAIPVKLADRIANIMNCIKDGNKGLFSMYSKEHYVFKCALWNRREGLRVVRMWSLLDSLIEEGREKFNVC